MIQDLTNYTHCITPVSLTKMIIEYWFQEREERKDIAYVAKGVRVVQLVKKRRNAAYVTNDVHMVQLLEIWNQTSY